MSKQVSVTGSDVCDYRRLPSAFRGNNVLSDVTGGIVTVIHCSQGFSQATGAVFLFDQTVQARLREYFFSFIPLLHFFLSSFLHIRIHLS